MVNKIYSVSLRKFSDTPTAKTNNDLETVNYIDAQNYRDAVKIAKNYSCKIGQTINNVGCSFELAGVAIELETEDDGDFEQVWNEYYKDGKKVKRYTYPKF